MNDVPEYLEAVVEEAIECYENSDSMSLTEVAVEIASQATHLTTSVGNDRDNLEVLQDLRDCDSLCTDELDTYRNYSHSTDPDEKTIEAIVIRSLEELLHNELQERFLEEA